jgi:hypothetical protein
MFLRYCLALLFINIK